MTDISVDFSVFPELTGFYGDQKADLTAMRKYISTWIQVPDPEGAVLQQLIGPYNHSRGVAIDAFDAVIKLVDGLGDDMTGYAADMQKLEDKHVKDLEKLVKKLEKEKDGEAAPPSGAPSGQGPSGGAPAGGAPSGGAPAGGAPSGGTPKPKDDDEFGSLMAVTGDGRTAEAEAEARAAEVEAEARARAQAQEQAQEQAQAQAEAHAQALAQAHAQAEAAEAAAAAGGDRLAFAGGYDSSGQWSGPGGYGADGQWYGPGYTDPTGLVHGPGPVEDNGSWQTPAVQGDVDATSASTVSAPATEVADPIAPPTDDPHVRELYDRVWQEQAAADPLGRTADQLRLAWEDRDPITVPSDGSLGYGGQAPLPPTPLSSFTLVP